MGAPPRPSRLPNTARSHAMGGSSAGRAMARSTSATSGKGRSLRYLPHTTHLVTWSSDALHGTHGRAPRVAPGPGGDNKDPSHGPGLQVRRMHDFVPQPCVFFSRLLCASVLTIRLRASGAATRTMFRTRRTYERNLPPTRSRRSTSSTPSSNEQTDLTVCFCQSDGAASRTSWSTLLQA